MSERTNEKPLQTSLQPMAFQKESESNPEDA